MKGHQLNVHGFMDVHVIDIERGLPATGLVVELRELSRSGVEQRVASGTINSKGSTDFPLFAGCPVPIGQYELQFWWDTISRTATAPPSGLSLMSCRSAFRSRTQKVTITFHCASRPGPIPFTVGNNDCGSSFRTIQIAAMSAFGGERTWLFALHMSAYDPKRTSDAFLFNYLIRQRNQPRRNGESERFGGLKIDHEFVLGGLKDWQVGRLCALRICPT